MFTTEELGQINRFLSTLDTCEYMGVAPTFTYKTYEEFRAIWSRVIDEETASM
jgi:hypothetical protein